MVRTHLESASASHRGAAASSLDLSELQHGAFHCEGKTCTFLEVRGRDGKHSPLSGVPVVSTHLESASAMHVHLCSKHSPPECQSQTRPRTLRLPPPHTVEQPQACSISRSLMAAPLQKQPPARALDLCSKHSPPECQSQTRPRTLRLPPPHTVEQPQACSISRSLMAAPWHLHVL